MDLSIICSVLQDGLTRLELYNTIRLFGTDDWRQELSM